VRAQVQVRKVSVLRAIHQKNKKEVPWRRGEVVIKSAYKTKEQGFESRRGERFSGLYALQFIANSLLLRVFAKSKFFEN
jgi:hypothetical protein